MMRRPPRSALVPCTTLFRSSQHQADMLVEDGILAAHQVSRFAAGKMTWTTLHEVTHNQVQNHARQFYEALDRNAAALRSEEHTSELQSRQYFVCRLLLEKK